MSDERLRELERDPHLSDADMDELVRLYRRDPAPHFANLEAKLVAHIGRADTEWCDSCIDGRGHHNPANGGTLSEAFAGLSRREVACPKCEGTGRYGPLRFSKGLMRGNYDLLMDPASECHKTKNLACFVESVSVNRHYGGIGASQQSSVRGHLWIATRRALMIASCAPDDWVGHQLLTKWLGRPNVANRQITVASDVAALKRLGAITVPGPLVALWCGAGTDPRCACGHRESAHAPGQPDPRKCLDSHCNCQDFRPAQRYSVARDLDPSELAAVPARAPRRVRFPAETGINEAALDDLLHDELERRSP